MKYLSRLFSTEISDNIDAIMGWLMGTILGSLALTGIFFLVKTGTSGFTEWDGVRDVFIFIGAVLALIAVIGATLVGLFFLIAKLIYVFERPEPQYLHMPHSPIGYPVPMTNISQPYVPTQTGDDD